MEKYPLFSKENIQLGITGLGSHYNHAWDDDNVWGKRYQPSEIITRV